MVYQPYYSVLYEDEQILAVSKPAGISVIHDSHRLDTPNLVERLEVDFGKLWVVHRLDRDTSGVLVFARTNQVHKKLNNQFLSREVKKQYHLLACGAFTWVKISLEYLLSVDGDRQHRTIVVPHGGKPARTDFEIIEIFDHSIYFIGAVPHTGYTHQIRAHLSSANGSILFDPHYRPHPFPPGSSPPFDPAPSETWAYQHLPIRRLSLHASKIEFFHPLEEKIITIIAPFPENLDRSLAILKSKGQA